MQPIKATNQRQSRAGLARKAAGSSASVVAQWLLNLMWVKQGMGYTVADVRLLKRNYSAYRDTTF